MKHSAIGIWCGLCVVLATATWTVWSNENILRNGHVAYLELAPVDPRSLMQGDYMDLRYTLENEARAELDDNYSDAYLIVRPDENGIAQFVRLQETLSNKALSSEELAIHYRVRNGRVKIATNAFFFQEGNAELYENARYGEFRISPNGEPRLVGLRNDALERLGKNSY